MAVATIVNTSERFDLKSAPPDGFVVVRRMSYGEKLKRQGMMTKFRMEMGRNKSDTTNMDVDLDQEKVTIWEFQNLIVEHNLTDENLTPLNFKNVADIVRLGPVVGEEIQTYIDKLNSFEADDDVKN